MLSCIASILGKLNSAIITVIIMGSCVSIPRIATYIAFYGYKFTH